MGDDERCFDLMQVCKPHRYNHDVDGIHYEFALDARCVKRMVARVQVSSFPGRTDR